MVAALTNDGQIHESAKFPTPAEYEDFLPVLRDTVVNLTTKDFRAGAIGAPGQIDHKRGVFKAGGRLGWRNEHLVRDIERITHCPMLVENDAKLAGLSEAMLLKDKHARVLYLTVSTGIGGGLIIDQAIDRSMDDTEPGHMMLQRGTRLVKWEDFASGKAIFERYGKKASDINDEATWRAIAKDLAVGFIDLIAVMQPDVIVVGGGIGTHLPKFHDLLVAELKHYETPLVHIPPVVQARRPEEAVVYGCYDLARSVHK